MFNEKIFQNHIRKVVGLENTEAQILISRYKQALESLKAQLLQSPDNSFTETKLNLTILQVEQAIIALESSMAQDMQQSFDFMSEQGAEDSVKEVNFLERKFAGSAQPVPIEAIMASFEPDNFLLNNYATSIKSYNQDLRAGIQNVLTQGLIQRKTLSQVTFDIEQYMRVDTWKVLRIARTELHQIYNVAKMTGFENIKENYVPDLKKSLIHPMDNRTGEDSKQLAKNNPIVDIDKPFVQNYNGKKLVFMVPPNRPNDRAILVPYRESYDNR